LQEVELTNLQGEDLALLPHDRQANVGAETAADVCDEATPILAEDL